MDTAAHAGAATPAPGALLGRKTTQAVVVTCMDFRFREGTIGALHDTFGVSDFDLVSLAGGAKSIASPDSVGRRRAVLDDIEIAVQHHGISMIVLLNHQQCGKYALGGHVFTASQADAERHFHETELRRAYLRVAKKFPGVRTVLGFLHVAPHEKVAIERIKTG